MADTARVGARSAASDRDAPGGGSGPRPGGYAQSNLVVLGLLCAILAGQFLGAVFTAPALQTWCTMFVAIVLQAVPFLVLGVLLAALVSQFLTEPVLRRILPPGHPVLSVPLAGIAGIALPGCECGSVPIAASLVRNGALPAAAFTFLLSGPAINPVVLVATAMAFPGHPEMVAARFGASLLTAVVVGWVWAWRGRDVPLQVPRRHEHHGAGGRVGAFVAEARHEFVHTAGFLVLGASLAAAVNTFVPRTVLNVVAGHEVLSVIVMALFAVVVAMCSEADAFVAASLTAFSPLSRLVFLVVGPAIDVKLATMHAGHFGSRFAARFGPLAFVVAVASALAVGSVLL